MPPGFAHTVADGLGTAQSRYLGREVSGGRNGNYLSDCLLTTETEPYGAIRPAQLLESEVWRDTPFETTECPIFDGFLQPGPLTNDDLKDWILGDPRRPDVLKRLVSVLEDPSGPSIIIISNTAQDAVRWIAAATILLPIRLALEVSFKVFVNNVNQAPQRIVAVPKELNHSVRPDAPGSRFVVDATDESASVKDSTERATYWVDRLVSAEDAYDVVEAVDLAEVLTGNDRAQAADARETAWAITADEEPVTNPSALIRWLTLPKPGSQADNEAAAARRLLESNQADASTLSWMEWRADAGRLEVNRADLRRALLNTEIAEAPSALSVRPEELAPVDIGEGPRRDAESEISSALLLAEDDGLVDRLLRTAKRHSIPLALTPLQDRLRTFVAGWITNPTLSYDPGRWALSKDLVEELAAQLTARGPATPAGGYPQTRPLLTQAWPYLLQCVREPGHPLTWELHAASVATLPEKSKLPQVDKIIGSLSASPSASEALLGFQRALVAWRALASRDAMLLIARLPPETTLAPELADLAWSAIASAAKRPNALLLDTLRRAARSRPLPFTPVTDGLLSSDKAADNFLTAAFRLTSIHDAQRLPRISKIDPHVFRIRRLDFVAVTLESQVPTLGAVILERLSLDQQRDFLDAWRHELTRERSALAAARGYVWCENPGGRMDDWQRQYIRGQVSLRAAEGEHPERASWLQSVQRLLAPDEVKAFDAFISDEPPRRLKQKSKPSFHGGSKGPPKRSKRERPKAD